MFRKILVPVMLAVVAVAHAYEPSGSLPVIYIDTPGRQPITSKTDYVQNATYWIDPMGQEGIDAVGAKDAPLLTQIRGRGNYTWTGFEKKPYRLKLDTKQAMLGMNKSRHWALMAHADDNLGFLRAPLAFKLSEIVGLDWTPSQQPVEVVLNGEYIGLYFLTETVRVANDRVSVTEQADNDPSDPTGGWLPEIDNYEDESQLRTKEGDGSDLYVTYHSPELLCQAQDEFLRGQISALDRAFYDGDKKSTKWESLVDKESLAAYYIVQEMTDNYESFHGSCYFHRNRGNDSKWVWGPVWDFGSTFLRDNGKFMYDSPWHQTWIPEIVRFESFRDAYKDAMRRFIDDGYAQVTPYIKNYAKKIASAAKADAERWPQYANADVEAKAADILARWKERVGWLAQQWDIDAGMVAPTGIYLRGEMTSWNCLPVYEFARTESDGVYELRDVTISGDFKIATSDWGEIDFGRPKDGGSPVADEWFDLSVKGENMSADGEYTKVVLSVDRNNGSGRLLLSTEPVEDDPLLLEEISSSDRVRPMVWASSGRIYTDARRMTVYTVQGAVAGSGTSVDVCPGLYIVMPEGGKPQKILVR